MNEKRKAFYAAVDAQLDAWGAQIEHLKLRASAAKAEFLDEHTQTIEALQQRHAEAMVRLRELRASGDEAWDDLGAGLSRILAEGKTACHAAMSRFQD
jgi:hypothetical protein